MIQRIQADSDASSIMSFTVSESMSDENGASVLQCVVVCCSVLQCVAVRCSVFQCVAMCCNVLQCPSL